MDLLGVIDYLVEVQVVEHIVACISFLLDDDAALPTILRLVALLANILVVSPPLVVHHLPALYEDDAVVDDLIVLQLLLFPVRLSLRRIV